VKARASFRSQLLIGSVLWTLGLLVAVSVCLIQFLGAYPNPHRVILGWFVQLHMALALAIGGACMTAGAWQIWRSLAGVGLLRQRLAAVHQGKDQQLAGSYPAEVQPLVDDLNSLLTERELRVDRALAKAGDLAHGLKTPLAVLTRDVDRVAATGDTALAESMAAQVERMRRQIDYHLAHARAAAAGVSATTRSLVAPSVEGLVRTLQHLHAERGIVFHADIDPSHSVRCQREDLEEMLGNLLDNACKWGRGQVRIESRLRGNAVTMDVDDDGPGIEPSTAVAVMKRGVRADERVPGSGLGLAIVSDLAEIYGGSIELTRSAMGGLRARLQLPASEEPGVR
jgi:signal transduction histidine kinase